MMAERHCISILIYSTATAVRREYVSIIRDARTKAVVYRTVTWEPGRACRQIAGGFFFVVLFFLKKEASERKNPDTDVEIQTGKSKNKAN